VAAYQRQSVTVKEAEKVQKAQELEEVERNRVVALADIAKEKELEEQKKEIADLTSERISVEKRVAEEEENIERVRIVSKADREKEATIISAEAKAQEDLVREVKAAEAAAQKAVQKAQEEVTLAEGRKNASVLDAEAAIKQAEAVRFREAAPGLAKAEVLEVTAAAKEKDGLAEAVVLREKLEAQAVGDEKVGLAAVRVQEAEADAIEKRGEADAKNIELRFLAEAKGLQEKFAAMDAMSDKSRQHEEFRLKLDLSHTETLRWIEANTEIAKEQAEVLATALADAKIDIVGGSGDYFEKFVNALALGRSMDGIVRGETARKVFGKHLDGDADLVEDVKQIAAGLGGNSDTIQNLTVSAFIAKLMREGTSEQKEMLNKLIGSVSQ
jgi:hypothetical protein